MTIGIYSITNRATGDWYVGQSRNIEKRWRKHRNALNRGNHPVPRLQSAWNTYGSEAFVFDVVAVCSIDELDALEQAYLDMHPAYNTALVAGLATMKGRTFSAEHRRKMSQNHRGNSFASGNTP